MKYRFYCKIFNAHDDPEKLVLPSIVYVKQTKENISAHWVGIGWWHYGISFAIGIIKPKS